MASYKYIRHTAAEIDEAIEQEREHCSDKTTHTCQEEKDRWNGAAELAETNKSDILSAEKAIEINRLTLGTQVTKNLLNHTAKTETKNGVDITVNADGSITFVGTFTGTSVYYHQIYKNADGSNKTIGKGKYIVSGGVEEFGLFVKYGTNLSGDNGTQINVKNVDVPITIKNETEFIGFFVSLQPAMEYNATIYPMLRNADIADNTYEPYVPSLQEQINALVAEIAELKTQITTE